jgi:hypothetical protein
MQKHARFWPMVIAGMCLVGAPVSALAQTAALAGTVATDSSERRLPNAEISFPKFNRNTRSDSAGNFRVAGLEAGVHDVVIRLIGYEQISTTLKFEEAKTLRAKFLLRPTATPLAEVSVKDTVSPYRIRLADFEARRKTGIGRFLTAEVFEAAAGSHLGEVITMKLPNARLTRYQGIDGVIASTRSGVGLGRGSRPGTPCPMQVILNGQVMYRGEMTPFSLREVTTAHVIGLEFYSVANTPAQYGGTGASCGTVAIWTK